MPNAMKMSGGGKHSLALQVTRPVRQAGLVTEDDPADVDADGTPPYPTYRAEVRIYAFAGLLLVVDRNRMSGAAIADVVGHALTETQTVFRALDGVVIVMGQGYMLQLPNADDAGFEEGEPAPVQTAPNMLVIHKQTDAVTELADKLVSVRRSQVDH